MIFFLKKEHKGSIQMVLGCQYEQSNSVAWFSFTIPFSVITLLVKEKHVREDSQTHFLASFLQSLTSTDFCAHKKSFCFSCQWLRYISKMVFLIEPETEAICCTATTTGTTPQLTALILQLRFLLPIPLLLLLLLLLQLVFPQSMFSFKQII